MPIKTREERLFDAWSLSAAMFQHVQSLKTLHTDDEAEEALQRLQEAHPKLMGWLRRRMEAIS